MTQLLHTYLPGGIWLVYLGRDLLVVRKLFLLRNDRLGRQSAPLLVLTSVAEVVAVPVRRVKALSLSASRHANAF